MTSTEARTVFGLMRRCRRGDWEAAAVLRDWALEHDAEIRIAEALRRLAEAEAYRWWTTIKRSAHGVLHRDVQ